MSHIVISEHAGVLSILIDRPKKKNALTFAMYLEMERALRTADPAIRAIVISGSGDAFSAGNDISDFLAAGPMDFSEAPPARFIAALVDNTRPLIAAVNGRAIGVGATMLLHCDLVYASETARLEMPFVSLGLVPEAGSSMLLPARVGPLVAAEMLLLGVSVDATRAKQLGLVNDIVTPASELLAFAREKARELAAKPQGALGATRALLRGDLAALSARVREEGRQFAERLGSSEARDAFMAFLTRRAPSPLGGTLLFTRGGTRSSQPTSARAHAGRASRRPAAQARATPMIFS